MKTIHHLILIITAMISTAASAQQQLYNSGFEQWDTTGSYAEPSGWYTLNVLSQFGFPAGTTLSTDAHEGNYAVQLESGTGSFGDVTGILATGPILDNQYNPDFSKVKVAFTERPKSVSFYYKSMPMAGDTNALTMVLTKWNPAMLQSDTIGEVSFLSGDSSNTYQQATIDFTYYLPMQPDSMYILASSSLDGFHPVPGSKFILDDFQIQYDVNGLNDLTTADLLMYPNPSDAGFVVEIPESAGSVTLFCFDLNGKNLLTRTCTSKAETIETDDWDNGIYLLVLRDAHGNRITRKIAVAH